jgi:hypothetical protein
MEQGYRRRWHAIVRAVDVNKNTVDICALAGLVSGPFEKVNDQGSDTWRIFGGSAPPHTMCVTACKDICGSARLQGMLQGQEKARASGGLSE